MTINPSNEIYSSLGEQHLDAHYLFMPVRRWGWLFLLVFISIFSLSVLYYYLSTRYYRATVVVQVEQEEQHYYNPVDNVDRTDDLKGEDMLKTIEQNLKSPKLFVKVATDPKITSDFNFWKGPFNKLNKKQIIEITDALQKSTQITLRKGTRLIDLSVDHPDPLIAQNIAHSLIYQYIKDVAETETNSTIKVEEHLHAVTSRVKEDLEKSEDALATYHGALLLRERIYEQQKNLDTLNQRYKAKHPKYIQAQSLLIELTQMYDEEVKKIRTGVTSESDYWKQQDGVLSGSSLSDRVAAELRLVEARTNVLEGELETENALYKNILKQTTEASVSKEEAPVQIKIIEEPYILNKPVWPNLTVVLTLGLLGALFAGLFSIWLPTTLDSSFKTSEDIEHALRLPVLGTIGQIRLVRGKSSKDHFEGLALVQPSQGAIAEDIKTMRTSIAMLSKAKENKIFLFTSSLSGEGKTFIASNYAVALAQQNMKTLLIDTDIRNPAINRYFKLSTLYGFVDCLVFGYSVNDTVTKNVISNLDILTSGTRCPNPSELLSGDGLKKILEEALNTYDRIVVDSCPINLVGDTLLVIPYVHSTIFIVRSAVTPRKQVSQALQLLLRSGHRPVGCVLNGIPSWVRKSLPYPRYSIVRRTKVGGQP